MESINEIYNKTHNLCSMSYDCMKKIKKQMKKGICKIIINKNERGTGFFSKIPFPDVNNMIKVLITNHHIINEEYINKNNSIKIKIKSEEDILNINLKNRIIFTNEEYDTTIIEIKESDGIKYFLKLNEKIINDIVKNKNRNNDFIGQTIYITHYSLTILSFSNGKLDSIDESKKYFFNHDCDTNEGASGSPTFTLNNEVFGMHKGKNIKKYCGLGIFLSYPIKKFINEMKLKKINDKYNLIIKNTDVEKICLLNKGNINWKELMEIQFDKLKELTIYENNKKEIINKKQVAIGIIKETNYKELKKLKLHFNYSNIITLLEKIKFEKLEIIDLSLNKITDVNILTKLNFPELKELNLSNNNITDINDLINAKFEKLELLNLGINQVSEIHPLTKVNFKKLKKLKLNENKISNINELDKFDFEELEILDLSYNNISDINILEKVNFKKLKELYLNDNKTISNIEVLGNVEFKYLEILHLGVNNISNINILEKVDFKELKQLFLCVNKIRDINVLAKVNFPKLKMLSFGVNYISNIDVLEKVNFKDIEVLGFSRNKISDINVLSKTNFEKLIFLSFDNNYLYDNIKENSAIIYDLRKKVKRFYPFEEEKTNYYIHGILD